jgi:putative tryptophan/tyrosine transport system substrate-binding protein
MDLIRSAAANLIELNPDVILAVGARVIPILMELTHSIPIVAPSGADPIARGYAESLARPGGNVTEFATMELSIVGKMLQTLKEIAPDLAHVTGPKPGVDYTAMAAEAPKLSRERTCRPRVV